MKTAEDETKNLMALMRDRRSVRAFLPTPVKKESVEQILDIARYAASGSNMQPWQVHVLFQETITELYTKIAQDVSANSFKASGDYQYYPTVLDPPFRQRVKQSGEDLYASLKIGPRDTADKREQKLRNFKFYGAPVGLIVTMNRRLAQGSWIDIGIFLNALSLAVSESGMSCCLQASFSSYGDIVRNTLKIDQENLIICGISLGYEDKSNPINSLPKRRMTIDEFVEFYP